MHPGGSLVEGPAPAGQALTLVMHLGFCSSHARDAGLLLLRYHPHVRIVHTHTRCRAAFCTCNRVVAFIWSLRMAHAVNNCQPVWTRSLLMARAPSACQLHPAWGGLCAPGMVLRPRRHGLQGPARGRGGMGKRDRGSRLGGPVHQQAFMFGPPYWGLGSPPLGHRACKAGCCRACAASALINHADGQEPCMNPVYFLSRLSLLQERSPAPLTRV